MTLYLCFAPVEEEKYTTHFAFHAACMELIRDITLHLNNDRFIGFDSIDYVKQELCLLDASIKEQAVDFQKYYYKKIEGIENPPLIPLWEIQEKAAKHGFQGFVKYVPEPPAEE